MGKTKKRSDEQAAREHALWTSRAERAARREHALNDRRNATWKLLRRLEHEAAEARKEAGAASDLARQALRRCSDCRGLIYRAPLVSDQSAAYSVFDPETGERRRDVVRCEPCHEKADANPALRGTTRTKPEQALGVTS